jgi:hypothetical protein
MTEAQLQALIERVHHALTFHATARHLALAVDRPDLDALYRLALAAAARTRVV